MIKDVMILVMALFVGCFFAYAWKMGHEFIVIGLMFYFLVSIYLKV